MKKELAFLFILVFSVSFVSAVWWNPFSWFEKEEVLLALGDDSSLVLYLPLNGNTSDLSGGGNNGTNFGATNISAGKFGGSYYFDGINDYILVNKSSKLDFLASSGFSYSFWVKLASYPVSPNSVWIIGRDRYPAIRLTYTKRIDLCFETTDSSGACFSGKKILDLNKWYHISGVVDPISKKARIYINGTLGIEYSYSPFGSLKNTSNKNIILGNWDTTSIYWFNGTLDEVRIYNRSLSATEISNLYKYNSLFCIENWSCSAWSDCVDGNQTRSCVDASNCGTTINKPVERQNCLCINDNQCSNSSFFCYDGACTENPISLTNKSFGTSLIIFAPPSIEGDDLVWVKNGDVYLFNLLSKNIIKINKISYANNGDVKISGKRVVWFGGDESGSVSEGLNVYDIISKNETKLIYGATYPFSLYKENLVWIERWGGTNRYMIYYYNFTSGNKTKIVDNLGIKKSISIYQNNLVWIDGRSLTKWEVYMYDLSKKQETKLNITNASNVQIYGNNVVWEDFSKGVPDIYLYSLLTNKSIQLTNDSVAQAHPFIYKDKIVWDNQYTGDEQIRVYDLITNKTTIVMGNRFPKYFPSIYENTLIWWGTEDYPINVIWDVYLYKIRT